MNDASERNEGSDAEQWRSGVWRALTSRCNAGKQQERSRCHSAAAGCKCASGMGRGNAQAPAKHELAKCGTAAALWAATSGPGSPPESARRPRGSCHCCCGPEPSTVQGSRPCCCTASCHCCFPDSCDPVAAAWAAQGRGCPGLRHHGCWHVRKALGRRPMRDAPDGLAGVAGRPAD